MSTFFGFLSFIVLVLLVIGLIKPTLLKFQNRKRIFYIFGVTFVVLFVTGIVIPSPPSQNQSASIEESKQIQSPTIASDNRFALSNSESRDVKTLNAVRAILVSYKMPIQSGKWQICVVEKINTFNNLQLLSFYEWFKSLSPHSSEITLLTA